MATIGAKSVIVVDLNGGGMLILGWHGGVNRTWQDLAPGWSAHDGAAVLLRDGRVVAAVEEERLNRVKHSSFFPAQAIRRCAQLGAINLSDVDIIATNFAERTRQTFPADAGLPSVQAFLDDPAMAQPTVRGQLREIFLREFGQDMSDRFHFCHHHLAHLWSAWGPGGFPESLVISLDGSGDALSGMIAVGAAGGLRVLRELSVDQSLGNLYSDMIRFIGYKRFDEYKAMGLAPYGNADRLWPLFEQFFELLPGGDYRLIGRDERWALIHDSTLIPRARRAGEPHSQLHRDFAAALQRALETIVLHVVRHFAAETALRQLCYAGGVAHNSTLNGRLLRADLFDDIFVQPAAHDAGGALGAAVSAAYEHGEPVRPGPTHVFWGHELPDQATVVAQVASWDALVTFERLDDPALTAARLLADGAVIGWVQGRSEFGPRALGHRSILADPRPAENKARINKMIKKREAYRPFAPSVLGEHLSDVVELPACRADLSHMTFTLTVRGPYRSLLGATTHVDGSARIQAVSRATDPLYWRLIDTFRTLTGVPAVLNTSFNNHAEPIVDSVDDALACYLTTGLDAVLIGNVLVRRRDAGTLANAVGVLRPELPATRKLVARRDSADGVTTLRFFVEATAGRHFMTPRIAITTDLYRVLLAADGQSTLDELCKQHGISDAGRQALLGEVRALWEHRAVILRP